jgi:hypothetical protein
MKNIESDLRTYCKPDISTMRDKLMESDADRDEIAQTLSYFRTLAVNAETGCDTLTNGDQLEYAALAAIGEDHDDNCGNHIYEMPNNIWVHDYQHGQIVCHHEGDLESFIRLWDFCADENAEDTIISFGGEPTLDEVYTAGTDDRPEDEEGSFQIWVRYSYYSGCGNPADGWAREDSDYVGGILNFESLHAAIDAAEEMEESQYDHDGQGRILRLSHNQAGSTDFVVCRL